MAVGGLAGPSRNLKPSIPAPTWPVLTSTVPGPPPLVRRDRSRWSPGHMQTTWCLLLNNHVPYTRTTSPPRTPAAAHEGPRAAHVPHPRPTASHRWETALAPRRSATHRATHHATRLQLLTPQGRLQRTAAHTAAAACTQNNHSFISHPWHVMVSTARQTGAMPEHSSTSQI